MKLEAETGLRILIGWSFDEPGADGERRLKYLDVEHKIPRKGPMKVPARIYRVLKSHGIRSM